MNRLSSQAKQKTHVNGAFTIGAVRGGTIKRSRLRKSIPKAGMVGSLGTLVISGIVRFKGAKSLHVWSGYALVGFSIWHYLQNRPRTKNVSDNSQ